MQAPTQNPNKNSRPVLKKLSVAWPKMQTTCRSVKSDSFSCRETLKRLQTVCVVALQTSGLAGDDLVKALEGLGLEEGGEAGGEDGNILPIMQSIMQNLLSKEVLYPSLKEITTKVCICFLRALTVLSSSATKCRS